MNWDDIQNQWLSDSGESGSPETGRMLRSAQERSSEMRRKIRRRDILETTIALLIAPVFGYFGWKALGVGLWITAFAAIFLAAWCLYVPWRLRKTRNLFPDPETSNDMLAYLQAERRAMQGQYELLRGIFGWYLGPAGFGVLLFFASVNGLGMTTLIYTLFVLVLYALIYIGNQRAATKKFAPAVQQIDQQIAELSDATIQGETQ